MSDPALPTRLAPHHQRLFALILDYLIALTLLKLLDQLTLGAAWDLRPVAESKAGALWVWAVGLLLILLFRDGWRGLSPGKWLAGLVVVRADDPARPPPLSRLVLRNLPLVLLPVEGVLVFLDPHCRRLGDRLAGTVVVAAPAPAPLPRRLLGLAVLFLGLMLASFVVAPWNMHRSAAYQAAHAFAAGHPKVAAAVGTPNTLDTSPTFELHLEPQGGSATLTFTAEGPRGEAEAEVKLRLATGPRRWELDTFTVRGPAAPEPLVKEAPAR